MHHIVYEKNTYTYERLAVLLLDSFLTRGRVISLNPTTRQICTYVCDCVCYYKYLSVTRERKVSLSLSVERRAEEVEAVTLLPTEKSSVVNENSGFIVPTSDNAREYYKNFPTEYINVNSSLYR